MARRMPCGTRLGMTLATRRWLPWQHGCSSPAEVMSDEQLAVEQRTGELEIRRKHGIRRE